MSTSHTTTTQTMHPGAEQALRAITLDPLSWEKHRELRIESLNHREFSNEHWKAYLDRIVELRPRKLIIETPILTDIRGAHRLTELEEIYIGNDTVSVNIELMAKQPELLEMLKEIAQLPSIKAFSISTHIPYMGHIKLHRETIDCLKEIQRLFPDYKQCRKTSTGLKVNIKIPVLGEAF
jgi:hypothetical protein